MKTVIVGLGSIGQVHAKVLQAQGREIVAVCDTDVNKKSLYSSVTFYTDYKKMLNEISPDVVHICTPHYLHADMIIEALERNINVLCEKPLCIRMEDIERILQAEKDSKAILGVCHQNRYNAFNVFIKERLKGKTILGGYATVVWSRDKAYYQSADWRGKWATEGGGVLINQALHTLDLMQWFCGFPKEVTASISNLHLKDEIEVEDCAVARFSGNSEFCFYATTGSIRDFPVEITIQTNDELIKIINETVLINGEKIDFSKATHINGKACYGIGHGILIAGFYDCIETGRKFDIDGTEASKVIKMILGVYASNGKRMVL